MPTQTEMDKINEFVKFVEPLHDEKSHAQPFCDQFFRAFGHGGIIQANGTLEARIKFNDGSTKFADCLWSPPGHRGVLIEMKSKKEKNLEKHFPQVRDYWIEMNPEKAICEGAQKPEYIILCNFDKMLIYRYLTLVDEIQIKDLPDRISALNFMFLSDKEPIFKYNIEQISKEAAGKIGELFKYLIFEKKEKPLKTQRFILQCVLALFSEDFELLPKDFFTSLILESIKEPQNSYDLLGNLFRQMADSRPARGGRFKEIKYFNGGLFKDIEPIELDLHSLMILNEVSKFKWQDVDPSIFGALFESTMNEKERHAFGAHFTSEVDILKIVHPTITKPWKQKIEQAKKLTDLENLLKEISTFKVLDPACGCGNFLFVAYKALKDIELMIIEKIADNYTKTAHLSLGMSRVMTKQFFGIDIQPVAVEVTKMTMMLAKEIYAQIWNKRIRSQFATLGLTLDEALPLDSLDDNILCRDAILSDWPEFDVVIGNPPFQSKNKMKIEMSAAYVNMIQDKYPDMPGRADYCVYWFRKAHELMRSGQRAGFVGTNTIRQNDSRVGGLDYIVQNGGTITDAVSTQVWSGDAAVHVSVVNWLKGEDENEKLLVFQKGDKNDSPFEYYHPARINSALSNSIDVAGAQVLTASKNSGCCLQGQTHGNDGFLIDIETAENLIKSNQKLSEVLFPFLIADEMIGKKDSLPTRYVIDFRKHDAFGITKYPELFKIIKDEVYPDKEKKARDEEEKNTLTLQQNPKAKVNHHHKNFFNQWWKLSWARNELMNKLETIPRYCVCGQVTKRPIFEFISSSIHPNAALQVFPVADDYSFGILQSNIHWEWFKVRCSTLTERFRYTSDTVFDSFPWPQKPTEKDVADIATYAEEFRLLRRKVMQEYNFSLRDLYRMIEETPNNPVSDIQNKLDNAVRKAYGMKPKDDVLQFLLDLNLKLHENELSGEPITGPGFPDFIEDHSKYISVDCVKFDAH